MTVAIARLYRYAVKGCAATELDTATLSAEGIEHDRRMMLVEPDGTFLSQRQVPRLAVLAPRVHDDRLHVRAPDAELDLDIRYEGPRIPVSLFGRWFGSGVDQGDRAAAWFGERIGRQARLVRTPPDLDRPGWGDTPGRTGFADAHAVLVCTLSTLDELNARILERGGEPVPMNRFRPNIVLTGWPRPHAEDRARVLRAGTAELAHSARAIRCAVPTVDQATGQRDGPEPTRTLADYRREPELGGGVSFGAKMAVTVAGAVRVGDAVEVPEWLPEEFTALP